MRILVGGDFFVGDEYKDKLLLDNSITQLFETVDFRILNQEGPITECVSENRIIKTGPHLKTSESTTIPFLKALNIDLVTLANNHILDYGEKGLNETIKTLNKNQINHIGAGRDLKEASKVFSLRKNGFSIGIINFTENEWASASEVEGGAAPMNLIDNVKQLQSAKNKHDKVICIIHGGHEYYNLPSPRMQKQYRFYAENGADLIIGHHPHCISGFEIYNEVPIFYSLGNFIFTKPSNFEDWYLGLVLEIEISSNGKLTTKLHPVRQNRDDFRLDLILDDEKPSVLKRVSNYSEIIWDEKILYRHWEEFVEKNREAFLNLWAPTSFISNKYLRSLLNKIRLTDVMTSRFGRALKLNLMRCEAHADLSKEILSRSIQN